MKIYGVLRGFPGLGRVSSGIALLKGLQKKGHSVKAVSYLQGYDALEQQSVKPFIEYNITKNDIMPIGLNPIEKYSTLIIESIIQDCPDLVIIDGEPLLTSTLCSVFDRRRIISILNPTDLINKSLPPSTINFYHSHYLSCSNSIVHGIGLSGEKWLFNNDCKVHCLNTILREEILEMEVEPFPEEISCILGGGTANATESFFESTVMIGKKIIELATCNKEYNFNIYCNDKFIKDRIIRENKIPFNVSIYDTYISPIQIYKNSAIVIARAGRNVSSELLYLGIPALLVATKGDFRSVEQDKNINDIIKIGKGNIDKIYLGDTIDIVNATFNRLLQHKRVCTDFEPGNQSALKIIDNILESL